MIRQTSSHRFRVSVLAGLAALAIALPAASQSTGMVKGKVVDDKGQPVEGATITIDFLDGVNRRQQSKTNQKGEFIQIGLFSGNYKVTADKEKLGSQSYDVRVRIGQTAEVNFQLIPGASALSKEDAAKALELRKIFEEGVQASRAGNYDGAIAAFTKGLGVNAKCYDCYYNIGYAYTQKKDYENAETSFNKAIELKADYADAYNGLANIYNAQRKFEQAAAASAKAGQFAAGAAGAAGGGCGDALYNQGVILWNSGKVAEAKKQFEAAIQASPNHAESHYQLGMALVNEGDLAQAATEFETYLKLAPEGANAAQAKALLSQLKK